MTSETVKLTPIEELFMVSAGFQRMLNGDDPDMAATVLFLMRTTEAEDTYQYACAGKTIMAALINNAWQVRVLGLSAAEQAEYDDLMHKLETSGR